MTDFFEIDFLDVESKKSGDAIPIRYKRDGTTYVHVVDGGFQDTGQKVIDHIRQYYDDPAYLNNVVVTHGDGDHAGGLRTVLEEFVVESLWMLRPWIYADEIIHRFSRFSSVENLKIRLREIYPNIAALEEIAERKGISIREPFQGAQIGSFSVLAPTRERYLDLIVESERTPESAKESAAATLASLVEKGIRAAISFIRAAWGEEIFSTEETSAENEMSVIQYANLCQEHILLTGDAGRSGLTEAADYAPYVGLNLPGIDRFQVPHHGSRRNVSSEVLDRWLGPCLAEKPTPGDESFTALISASQEDPDHPRRAVVRAMIHRGAKVISTEGNSIMSYKNAPDRNWSPVSPLDYPEDQEE